MYITLNESEIPIDLSSDGHCKVSISSEIVADCNYIRAMLFNSDCIISLMLIVDAIRRINPNASIRVFIPYLPYSRADKLCRIGDAVGIEVIAKIINSLECDEVCIVDPHSDAPQSLISRLNIIKMADIVLHSQLPSLINNENLLLVAPDIGAFPKVSLITERLREIGIASEVVHGNKVRDSRDGALSSITLEYSAPIQNAIVFDDVCDTGQTLIAIAKLLKARGAKKLYCYITHGVFASGIANLFEYYERIYCYNAFSQYATPSSQFIESIRLLEYIPWFNDNKKNQF